MLAKYFPVEEPLPRQPPSETPEDETIRRLCVVQDQAMSFAAPAEQICQREKARREGRHYSYRSEEDLPPVGDVFFRLAARLAGLSVPMLLRAVNMLEQHIMIWQRGQRKEANERRERSHMDSDLDAKDVGE